MICLKRIKKLLWLSRYLQNWLPSNSPLHPRIFALKLVRKQTNLKREAAEKEKKRLRKVQNENVLFHSICTAAKAWRK